jgi:hypothetical protein
MAKLVRYVRACERDGRSKRPDVAESIKMRIAMVLGDGYRESERRVPVAARALVFERANGRCEECGQTLDFDRSTGDPGAIPTIQHVQDDSNEPTNLKAFCRRCNMADARSRFVPVVPGSEAAARRAELKIRCFAPTAVRLCDDDEHWNGMWQRLSKDARQVIKEREIEESFGGGEDLPGFIGWTDQGTPIQEI